MVHTCSWCCVTFECNGFVWSRHSIKWLLFVSLYISIICIRPFLLWKWYPYILRFLRSTLTCQESKRRKYVNVVEQIGLNVVNAKCLEAGILSIDNPPYGFNTNPHSKNCICLPGAGTLAGISEAKSITPLNLYFKQILKEFGEIWNQ